LNKEAIIIFARNPESGKVKSRIAKILGDEKALEIYKKLLDSIYSKTRNLKVKKFLFLSEFTDKSLFDPCYKQLVQNGKDLGEKMHNAMYSVFKYGFEKVILAGTDVPGLNEEIINEAFEKLSFFDVVIGPSADGGYYLIGMKESDFSLFENIDWGNELVLSKSIERIKYRNKSCYILKELNDIDTLEDLKYFDYKNKNSG